MTQNQWLETFWLLTDCNQKWSLWGRRRKTLLRTMKLRRFQEDWRQGRTYYPNRYITLDSTGGREWKSGVRNSLPDAIFVFGILLCIFVCKFCQSLLPALKMTLDGWKHVSNKHLQSKSLQSLVLCHNDTQLPLVRHLNPVVGPRKNLQRFGLAWTKFFCHWNICIAVIMWLLTVNQTYYTIWGRNKIKLIYIVRSGQANQDTHTN